MVTNIHSKWGVRLGTLALWALAGASVVYWGLRLSSPPMGLPVPVSAPEPVVPDALALARLLGAGPVTQVAGNAPAAPNRFVLVGVLAGTASGGGAALIAVDGKPERPYRVGATIEDGLVLQSLSRRQARLGPSVHGATTMALDMPLKK